jgi:tRNA (mo5U34)-methyltransferase
MENLNSKLLNSVKGQVWFYEFLLPDGSLTKADINKEVLLIHATRLKKLLNIIETYIPDSKNLAAIDFASHQGYFTLELAKNFKNVLGIELRDESLAQANQICELNQISNVRFLKADLTKLNSDEVNAADLVLCYGLLYHTENPIQVLRLASQLTSKHILIETQVFPYDISGNIEDGNYLWQRPVTGVFALSPDYGHRREGGNTEFAVIPSLNTLVFLLQEFGFKTIEVLKFDESDYEQFRRGSRVIIYGQK